MTKEQIYLNALKHVVADNYIKDASGTFCTECNGWAPLVEKIRHGKGCHTRALERILAIE